MEHGEILNSLKSALSLRYNDKIIYQRKVAEALNTNIPSVRRRFSGKNSFTLKEISLISERLDIPIDEIFDNCSSRNSYPLEFLEYSLTHSGRNHNEVFYNTNEMFRYAGQSVNSQLCISCNKLPDVLKANYMGFARFTALQWLYLKFGPDSLVPLSDIPLLPDTEKLLEEYLSHIYSFKNIVCLLNNNIIGDYLSDIRQFYILEYLGREEAEILAAEVEKLLGGGFEKMCTAGRLRNGPEVAIYCTDSYIPSDIYIVESTNVNFTVLFPTPLNTLISKSDNVRLAMGKWFKLWKRPATLISQSGAHIRRQFMDKQYKSLKVFRDFIGAGV
ncbi:MAG: helix-turn-helix transcriptional regulator [Alistipes sp.]|nr:helix-turn-helix transcriptional regulator [Alistipes sp.]